MLPGRKCLLHQMCCFLTSYFNSLLPTKRNVITHLDCLLVLTITILTSEMVASPSFLIAPNQISFPQAITHTILYAVGPLPLQLALLWSNVFYWTMYINEGVLISLSLTRLYLLITVRALFKRKTKITVFYPPRSPVTTLFLAACDNIV